MTIRVPTAALLLLAAACSPAALSRAPTAAHPGVTVPRRQPAQTALPAARDTAPGAPGARGQRAADGEPTPRPYAQVVTPAASTRRGLFTTHQLGNRLLYEIPRSELGREMLLVTHIARNSRGAGASGFGGEPVGSEVLRWERRGNRILLRGVSHVITADSTLPIYRAVDAANYPALVASFNIEAFGPDSAAVIDVTRLFVTPSPEFGVGNRIRGSLDRERSFVERAAAYPDNIEVEATHTYNVAPPPSPGMPEQMRPAARTASVLMHWSMVRLPETPMMPRLHDSRVGFFSVGKLDYGTEEHRVSQRRFITRWRLECPPGQSVPCEPVKPIVYYVDPATPEQWRPYIRRGVEAWQDAFEEAGFRNAIVARDAPTPEQDPEWSAEDARHSVVRWLPSPIPNAVGPHVHDPRSGEILEADILMFHNILSLLRDWYFVQVAPLDPRAQRLPLPDSLMGRLLQHVVSHEVGHTLGLPHNMKASSMYPADSVRNADFVRRMGHTPSIMDYARFNYVAQPEDGIPVDRLIPDIGPYDRFAVKWGYAPVPGARVPEQEREVLDRWARAQDTQPWLRFSTPGTRGADLADHTEAVGDQDAVKSTRLGLRNLRRVMPLLIPAAQRPEADFSDLATLYEELVDQWSRELAHVVSTVGGVESQEKYGSQAGVRFVPLPRHRQVEAMRLLNEEAFRTPGYLLQPELLRRIEVTGAVDRVGLAQARLLASLLSPARLRRMTEFEALAARPAEVYTAGEMLGDLRRGLWSELAAPGVRIDAFRRNLQRAYLHQVRDRVNPPAPARSPGAPAVLVSSVSDDRALLRGELRALDAELRAALGRTRDRTTRLHLEDARAQIERILEGER